jgi:hypothetical protein
MIEEPEAMITLERTVEGFALQQAARWKITPRLVICLRAMTAHVLVFSSPVRSGIVSNYSKYQWEAIFRRSCTKSE